VEKFLRKSILNCPQKKNALYSGTFLCGNHANITQFIDIDICQKSSIKSSDQTEATEQKGKES